MDNIVDDLKKANMKGMVPPQNWTHRAIRKIEDLEGQLKQQNKIDHQWYRENGAHPGLNGLVAQDIDGHRCIGTEGTCDFITGEFS